MGDNFESSVMRHFHRRAELLRCYRKLYGSHLRRSGVFSPWCARRALVGSVEEDGNLAQGAYSQHYQDYEKYLLHAGSVSTLDEMNKFR